MPLPSTCTEALNLENLWQKSTTSGRRSGKAVTGSPPSATRKPRSNGSRYISGGVPPSENRKSSTRAAKRAKASFRPRCRLTRGESEEIPDSEEAEEENNGGSANGRSKRLRGTAEARRADAKRKLLDAQVWHFKGLSLGLRCTVLIALAVSQFSCVAAFHLTSLRAINPLISALSAWLPVALVSATTSKMSGP